MTDNITLDGSGQSQSESTQTHSLSYTSNDLEGEAMGSPTTPSKPVPELEIQTRGGYKTTESQTSDSKLANTQEAIVALLAQNAKLEKLYDSFSARMTVLEKAFSTLTTKGDDCDNSSRNNEHKATRQPSPCGCH